MSSSEAPVDRVVCPNCGTEVEIREALTRSIRADLERALQEETQRRGRKLQEKEDALRAREQAAAARAEELEAAIAEGAKRLAAEQVEKVRAEERSGVAEELAAARAHAEKVDAELRAAKKAQLALLEEKAALEKEREDIDLTVARRLDEERARIRADAKSEEIEQRELERKANETKIESMRKTIEELRKKTEQGSQQLQGEALELTLEELLGQAFPFDTFEPVPKGISGADLVQRVHSPTGQACGTILWEAKRTKAWNAAWLPKLRDDQRALKAELAVIVSVVLPADTQPPDLIDNVWVTSYAAATGLAQALRLGLIEVATAKQALVGQKDKMELLYAYLAGPEFRSRIEGLLDPFKAMREDLEKEKRSIQKLWAKREQQIERAMGSTAGLWGDLEGIVGGTLPALEAFQLPGLEDGEAE